MKLPAPILLISVIATASAAAQTPAPLTVPRALIDQRELDAAAEPPTSSLRPVGTPPATQMLLYALSMIGVKYKFGGSSKESGFDCSGFVQHVFEVAAAIDLPHNAGAMSKFGSKVVQSTLAPGDLLFFNTLGRQFSHVGIYLGDGRFVHAPSRQKSVEIDDMNDGYWKRRFNGARRLLESAPGGSELADAFAALPSIKLPAAK
jgi:cell wall-associated NlpC family hydrolase